MLVANKRKCQELTRGEIINSRKVNKSRGPGCIPMIFEKLKRDIKIQF